MSRMSKTLISGCACLAIVGATTEGAEPPKKFDLECSGYSYDERFREKKDAVFSLSIDLESMHFQRKGFVVQQIHSVNEFAIMLEMHQMGVSVISYVDRFSGEYKRTRVGDGIKTEDYGECELKPFSGFVGPKF